MLNDAIAKRVRKLRLSKGMTQDDLAEKCHVTRQAVSNWEMGKTSISVEYLMVLAELFDVPIDEIIYGKKQNEAQQIRRKYIVTSIVCGVVLLVGLVLDITLRPILIQIINKINDGIFYFLYVYVMDVVAATAAGALIPSLISIRKDIRLYGGRRRLATVLSIFCIAVWFFLCVGTMFGFVKVPIFIDMAMGRFAPITIGHYVLPFLFGMGMFLGSNQ